MKKSRSEIIFYLTRFFKINLRCTNQSHKAYNCKVGLQLYTTDENLFELRKTPKSLNTVWKFKPDNLLLSSENFDPVKDVQINHKCDFDYKGLDQTNLKCKGLRVRFKVRLTVRIRYRVKFCIALDII